MVCSVKKPGKARKTSSGKGKTAAGKAKKKRAPKAVSKKRPRKDDSDEGDSDEDASDEVSHVHWRRACGEGMEVVSKPWICDSVGTGGGRGGTQEEGRQEEASQEG